MHWVPELSRITYFYLFYFCGNILQRQRSIKVYTMTFCQKTSTGNNDTLYSKSFVKTVSFKQSFIKWHWSHSDNPFPLRIHLLVSIISTWYPGLLPSFWLTRANMLAKSWDALKKIFFPAKLSQKSKIKCNDKR